MILINSICKFVDCKQDIEIPKEFIDDEKIIRAVYSKHNINPNNNNIKANFFKHSSNELSCNRLDYSNVDCIKKLSVLNNKPDKDRIFYGFGCTSPSIIKKYIDGYWYLLYTPKEEENNPFHCDIKFKDEYVKLNQATDSRINDLIDTIKEKYWNFFFDKNTNTEIWNGGPVSFPII